MSRSEELRAELDEAIAIEEAAERFDAALAAHRADLEDPELKAAYRDAARELDELRTAAAIRVQGDARAMPESIAGGARVASESGIEGVD